MSDTPTNEPAEQIDGGAAVEIPDQWEGMTDAEKDETVDVMLTDIAARTGMKGTAPAETDDEPVDEPRRFKDPDTVE